MMDIRRIVIIALIINMLLGFTADFAMNPDQYNPEKIQKEIEFIDAQETRFESDQGLLASIKSSATTSYQESTLGNVITWGRIIVQNFVRALNPLSLSPSQASSTVEQIVIYFLILFRSLLTLLILIGAYLFFKGGKT